MHFSKMAGYTQTTFPQQGHPANPMYPPHGSSLSQQQHQPRLMYFITRFNGSIVPLIPVDELPFNFSLEDVPRTIPQERTAGMHFVACLPFTGAMFKAKEDATVMQSSLSQPTTAAHHRQYNNGKQYMAPDAIARQVTTNGAHHSQNLPNTQPTPMSGIAFDRAAGPSIFEVQSPSPSPSDPQAVIDAIVSSKFGGDSAARGNYAPKAFTTAPPSGKIPDPSKKTYCSYWIRKGECDYTQQGCMYKHEMPDMDVLRGLGFRETPEWWVQRNQAINLVGGARAGKKTVGSPTKPSDWLNRPRVPSMDSSESGGRDTLKEAAKSSTPKLRRHPVVVSQSQNAVEYQKAQSHVEKVQDPEKKISILQRPRPQSERTASQARDSSAVPAPHNSIASPDTDDLIDFSFLEPPSSSTVPSVTPSTSEDTSPGATPSTVKLTAALPPPTSTFEKIFVPKGESKVQHLADHAAHQHRTAARHVEMSDSARQAAVVEKIAKLDKQIQQAQKSKHLPGPSANRGLMASKFAPGGSGNEKGGEGRKSGRTPTGLRVRRPAVQCAEFPTRQKMRTSVEDVKDGKAKTAEVKMKEAQKVQGDQQKK